MFGRLTAIPLAVTLTVTLAACDSNKSATPPPFTPSTVPPTTNTPVPPQAQAGADAQAAYRRYLQTKVATAISGGSDIKPLSEVATGVILAAELNTAATYRGNKWRGTGGVNIVWTKVLKVAPAAGGQINEVTVQACLDSSKADAVDAGGKSVRKPGTPTRLLDDMQMRLTDGTWKAYYGTNKAAKC